MTFGGPLGRDAGVVVVDGEGAGNGGAGAVGVEHAGGAVRVQSIWLTAAGGEAMEACGAAEVPDAFGGGRGQAPHVVPPGLGGRVS